MSHRPKGTPVVNDNDLAQRTRNDNFWVRRILKFCTLACAILVIIGFTFLLVDKIWFDVPFRDGMANVVKDNFYAILIGAFAILGINIKDLINKNE